jgi:hypothetical protein
LRAPEAEAGANVGGAGGTALIVRGVEASLLRLDVVATDEGVLTGDHFARTYGIQAGECLGSLTPRTPSSSMAAATRDAGSRRDAARWVMEDCASSIPRMIT